MSPANRNWSSTSFIQRANINEFQDPEEERRWYMLTIRGKNPAPIARPPRRRQNMGEHEFVRLDSQMRELVKNYPVHAGNSRNISTQLEIEPVSLVRTPRKDHTMPVPLELLLGQDPERIEQCLKIIDKLKIQDMKTVQVLVDAIKGPTTLLPLHLPSKPKTISSREDATEKLVSKSPFSGLVLNPNAPEFRSQRVNLPSEPQPMHMIPKMEVLQDQKPLPGQHRQTSILQQSLQPRLHQSTIERPWTHSWSVREVHHQEDSYYIHRNTIQSNKQNSTINLVQLYTNDRGCGRLEPAYAEWVMAAFKRRYPLTGALKAEPYIDCRKRYATAIQQRLEYLLWRQKESKALRERSSIPKSVD